MKHRVKRPVRQWDRNRPTKPITDPLYQQVRELLANDDRSDWAKANVSGLSPATIKNWQAGKVHHPQASSLQMAARMLGKKIVLADG